MDDSRVFMRPFLLQDLMDLLTNNPTLFFWINNPRSDGLGFMPSLFAVVLSSVLIRAVHDSSWTLAVYCRFGTVMADSMALTLAAALMAVAKALSIVTAVAARIVLSVAVLTMLAG
jgi:hypothetical protein